MSTDVPPPGPSDADADADAAAADKERRPSDAFSVPADDLKEEKRPPRTWSAPEEQRRTVYMDEDEFTYKGEAKGAELDGEGSYIDKETGTTYTGGLWRSVRHGHGENVFDDGSKYVGGYEKGKKHGEGTLTYANGSELIGSFVNGAIVHGTLKDAAGGVFVGSFRAGEYSDGKYTWATGECYIGPWENNKRSGKGAMYYADGSLSHHATYVDGEEQADSVERPPTTKG